MRSAKNLFIVLVITIFVSATVIAQRTQIAKKPSKSIAQTGPVKNAAKAETTSAAQTAFDELKNATDVAERIAKLKKFIADFPRSELKTKAVEMLIISHVEAGEASFQSGDRTAGTEHFRGAAQSFEPTTTDGIFSDVIVKLPFNLFFRGERAGALEIAREIELKIRDNAPRLLALANFYLSTENAEDAKRLAARAAEVAPDSAAAQISLGMAHRIAFHLEAASQSYTRALELDPASAVAKRNLADAWRGLGQTDEALKLYRELATADSTDEAARNGLILTLFNSGNKDEAEPELAAALAQNPKNFVLQTGVAYWHAANGDGARATELASKAVEAEPRYVWGQIALARGLILEKRPLEAERALLTARQFGKFPTLDYELANAHFAAGLYAEATDDLRRSFSLKNGKLQTKLAGRSLSEAENFIELLSRERRASIFEPVSASKESEAGQLKELLAFADNDQTDDLAAVIKTAENFIADEDEMRVYRQLYAANKLLNRKIALDQILEITEKAIGGLEKSLDVPAATAAVLADELYEPRRLAATNGSIVNVPNVPRETLRQIMRGRVEEIAGWTLYQQNKPEEAVVRLRRAVGVLPESSAWWRSSYWKLGSALEAVGKPKEALEAYLKSYTADVPNEPRLVIIQGLYQRVNGSLDGLERRLSRTEAAASSSTTSGTQEALSPPRPVPTPTAPASFRNPLPNVIAEIVPPKPVPTPATKTLPIAEKEPMTAEINIEISPEATAPSVSQAKTERLSAAQPEISPTPQTVAESSAEVKVEPATPPPSLEIAEKSASEATTPVTKIEDEAENNFERKVKDTTNIISAPAAEPPASVLEPIRPEAETPFKTLSPLEAASEPEAATENNSADKQSGEQKSELSVKKETDAIAKELANADASALGRPRVVIRALNNPPDTPAEQTGESRKAPICTMEINQPQLSILRNGGTAALLVIFGNAADAEKLVVTPSSPGDINIVPQPSDERNSKRRLFQVYSTSEITRIYTITIESSCGKQEVKVKVR